jgi:hypothetical protein
MFSVLLLTRIVLLLKSKSTYVYFLNKQLRLIGLTNIHAEKGEALHFIGQFKRANNHLTELFCLRYETSGCKTVWPPFLLFTP